jgi:integrase
MVHLLSAAWSDMPWSGPVLVSPRKGAHQFRHALACQMLRQGPTLIEIGALLRHRSPQTTAIYAKVDLAANDQRDTGDPTEKAPAVMTGHAIIHAPGFRSWR